MSEPSARGIPVVRGGKRGAEEEHDAIRVLMVFAHRLFDQIQRIATDFRETAATFELEAIGAPDPHGKRDVANVVDGEALITKPDERPDGTRSVIVLRLAEQQRGASFEIP